MKTHVLSYLLSFYFYFLLNIFSLSAQNEDTPNLSFEFGDFTGWKLYTGEYFFYDKYTVGCPYADAVPDEFNMYWTEVATPPLSPFPSPPAPANSYRFQVMGTLPGTADPIVACSNFFVNPDGARVARIGVPYAAEGNIYGRTHTGTNCTILSNWNTGKYTTAEKMTYTFTVTPQSTLLIYKFAVVLKDPSHSDNPHIEDERPAFSLDVTVNDGSTLPCSSFKGRADIAGAMERNKTQAACATGGGDDYVFRNWTTGMINLAPYVGKEVTIDIEVHDCIVQQPNCNGDGGTGRISGSHEAYGYFWGETRELKLEPRNCVTDDAFITATNTEGLLSYEWSRSDGRPVITEPGQPYIARIPQTEIFDGVIFYCKMKDNMGCAPITLSTELPKIIITPKFSYENECGGEVHFTNLSTIVADSIQSIVWDFGDGSPSSYEENPVHVYKQSGKYPVKLRIISYAGCEKTIEVPIDVRYFPFKILEEQEAVCYNDLIILSVLDAEMGSTFLWSNGADGQIMIDTAKISKDYKVTVIDPYTCEYTKTIHVSVKPNPIILIAGNMEVCVGDTTTLRATGADAGTYVWSNGITGPLAGVRPLSDQVITVSGTYNGCPARKDTIVKVKPLPVIYITGPDTICRNASAQLTAHGAQEYLWSDLFAGDSRDVSPLNDSTYMVTGVANGCISSATKTLRVKPNPVLKFSGDTIICLGDRIMLTAREAITYVWDDGSTNETIIRKPERDTIYWFDGSISGCTVRKHIPIKVLPSPVLWIDGIKRICDKDTLRLKAGGADHYVWSTGSTNDSIKAVPSVSTTYRLQGFYEYQGQSGGVGCSSTIDVDVIVDPIPIVKISGPYSACENTPVTLKVQGNLTGLVYTWSTGALADSISPVIINTETFTVTGKDTILGCRGQDSRTVQAIPHPQLDYETNSPVCAGDMLTVLAKGAASYVWHNGAIGSLYMKVPEEAMDTIYSVTGTSNGCSAKLDIPIQVLPVPTVWIEGKTHMCDGETIVLEAKGANTYTWSTGKMTNTIDISPSVNSPYQVTGHSLSGCTSVASIAIEVHYKPSVSIVGEKEICENNYLPLTAQGDAATYTWGDGVSAPSINPYITTGSSTFTLTGKSAFGCENTATHTVNAIPPPVITVSGNTIVCAGEIISLLAQGATTYVWHDGSTLGSYVNRPYRDTIYTVTGSFNGCTSKKDIPVNVYPVPTLLISGNFDICIGETTTLTVNGADRYIWSTGDHTNSIQVTPSSSSSYQVQGINDGNNCMNVTSAEVIVHSPPVFTIEGKTEVCENSFVTLTAQGEPADYRWDNGINAPSINPYITAGTSTFTVTGTSPFGCVNMATHSVKGFPHPVITYDGNTVVCKGEFISLNVQGATDYVWHDGSTSVIYANQPNGNTIYSVTGTTNGCAAKIDIPITVLPPPSIWTTGKAESCEKETIRLWAHGAETYRWSDGNNTDELVIVSQASTTYQLQGTDENGCSNTIQVPITVHPNPVIAIKGEEEVCENTDVTLTAQGADNYLWDTGYAGSTIRPLVEKTTVYTVKGTDFYGCSGAASHTVRTIPLPGLNVRGDTDVCVGEMLTLIGEGAEHYKWSDGRTGSIFTMYPTISTQITMTGTVSNCSVSIPVPITVHMPPTVHIAGDEAGCINTPFTLYATGAQTYEWSTGDRTPSITYTLREEATYSVTGTDANGCKGKTEAGVKIHPNPEITIKLEDIFGCPALPDTVILSASGVKTYQWSSIPYNEGINGKIGEFIRFEIEEETRVFVEGESAYGCLAADTFVVERLVHAPFLFTVSPAVIEKGSSTVRFNGISPSDYQWYWTPGDGTSERKGNHMTYSFPTSQADSFLVSVRNVNNLGCGYEGEAWVYVWNDFWAPDVFTPNNDNLNDTFHFFGEEYITKFSYIIYNRLGEIVFTGNSLYDVWDGTYKGKPCPWGVYGWVVNYKSDFKGVQKEGEKKGFVTLVR